jgi:hypothetical protein
MTRLTIVWLLCFVCPGAWANACFDLYAPSNVELARGYAMSSTDTGHEGRDMRFGI